MASLTLEIPVQSRWNQKGSSRNPITLLLSACPYFTSGAHGPHTLKIRIVRIWGHRSSVFVNLEPRAVGLEAYDTASLPPRGCFVCLHLGRSGPTGSSTGVTQSLGHLIGSYPLLKLGSDPGGLSEQQCRLPVSAALDPALYLPPAICMQPYSRSAPVASFCFGPALCLILALSLVLATTACSYPLAQTPDSDLWLKCWLWLSLWPLGQITYVLVPNKNLLAIGIYWDHACDLSILMLPTLGHKRQNGGDHPLVPS